MWAYKVVDEGTLYLEKAPGTAAIVRETDTGIAHIRGDSYLSVVYAQGFAHAQTRLWQLERTRRVIRGEISELFGEDTLNRFFGPHGGDEGSGGRGGERETQRALGSGFIIDKDGTILTNRHVIESTSR